MKVKAANTISADAKNDLKTPQHLPHSRNMVSVCDFPPDYSSRNSFTKTDLERCADGHLFGISNAQLPSAPLLMLDRIVEIQTKGGEYDRGYAVAELDLSASSWFFEHHFHSDPVMPGCFLIESLWQLTGFYLAWSGHEGKGRVLESGRTRFIEPVLAENQTLHISIEIRKILYRKNPICIANGEIRAGKYIKCISESVKLGLF